MNDQKKLITLIPSWKNYFWGYFLAVLLSPLLIGFIILWIFVRKNRSTKFEFSDTSIRVIENGSTTELALVDINSTKLNQSSFQSFLKIGDIKLQGNVSKIILEGIEKPESLLDKIDTAIAYQKELLNQKKSLKREEPKYDPGSMDKLDQLTGMWQQGLISDKDFDEERKKFE